MRIANKITLSFLITVSLLAGVASPIFYREARDNLEEAIFNHLITTVRSRVQHIETFLKHNKETLKQLSKSIVIRQFLLTGKEDEDYGRKLNAVDQRLKDTCEAFEDTCDIFVLDKDGIIVASDNESDIGLDKSADPYFLNAKEDIFIKDLYMSKYTKAAAMAFSIPVTDNKTGKFLGVIVDRSKLDKLNNITTCRTGLGKTGEIYIINKDGYMITPSRFTKDTFLKQRVDTEITRESFQGLKIFSAQEYKYIPFLYTNYRGVRVLGLHEHIRQMPWILIAEIDEKEVLAPLWRIKFLLISIIIITPILAWLIGIFVGGFISRPINVLHKGSEVIGSGNLDYKVGTDAKDEIGQLSRAFDKMTGDLKKTVVSKDYVDNILSSMADILVVTTPEGIIGKVNRATLDVFGYNEEELIGKDVSLLFPKEEMSLGTKTKLEKLIKEGTLRGYEIDLKTKSGRKISVLLSDAIVKAIDCEKILSIVYVAKDITERKKAEGKLQEAYTKLKETQSQLIQAEKMQAIGIIASSVAHEVKNPLGVIQQCIDYLEGETFKDNKTTSKIFVTAKDNILKASNIINTLLDFSRQQKLKLKKEGVNSILEDSLVLVENKAKLESIEVIKELEKNIPKISLDRGKIEQVIFNLCSNAIQAMPEGGKLYIRSYLADAGKAVKIEIEDTGLGIEKEDLKKIFDPFFSKRSRKKGTGLGLYVVKSIVDLHQGRLDAESEVESGTKFTLTLKV